MNKKKLILLIASVLLLIGAAFIYNTYTKIYGSNTIKEGAIFINTNSTLKELENEIRPFLKDAKSFTWVANQKKYNTKIRAGKFKILKGISNNDLINLLRSGKNVVTVS